MKRSPLVRVKLFAGMREAIGQPVLELVPSGPSVRSLFEDLEDNYREAFSKWIYEQSGQFRPGVMILVNDDALGNLAGLDTRLKDGDLITIVLPVAGG